MRDQLAFELDSLREDNITQQEHNILLSETCACLQKEVNEAKEEAANAHHREDHIRAELSALECQLKALQLTSSQVNTASEQYTLQVQLLEVKLSSTEADLKTEAAARSASMHQVKALQSEIERVQSELDDLQGQIRQAHQNEEQARNECLDLQHCISVLREAERAFVDDKENSASNLRLLATKLATAEEGAGEAQCRIAELEGKLTAAQLQECRLCDECVELRQQIVTVEAKRHEELVESTATRTECEVLKDKCQTFERESTRLHEDITCAVTECRSLYDLIQQLKSAQNENVLNIENHTLQVRLLQEKLKETERALQAETEQRAAMGVECEKLKEMCSRFKINIEGLQEDLERTQNTEARTRSECDVLQARLADAERFLTDTIDKHTETARSLEEKLVSTELALKLESELSVARECKMCYEQLETCKSEIASLKEEVERSQYGESLARHEHHKLEERVAGLKESEKALMDSAEVYHSRVKLLTEDLEISKSKLTREQEQNNAMGEANAALRARCDSSESTIAELQREMRVALLDAQTSALRLQDADIEKATLQQEIETLEEQLKVLVEESDVAKLREENSTAELSNIRAVLLERETEMQAPHGLIQSSQGELQELKAERTLLNSMCCDLAAERQTVLSDFQALSTTVHTQITTLQQQIDSLQTDKETVEAEASALRTESELLHSKNERLEDQLHQQLAKQQTYHAELVELQGTVNNLQRERGQLKLQLNVSADRATQLQAPNYVASL
jgi:chromosome segregation ATPase